jgi:hypothetical protein
MPSLSLPSLFYLTKGGYDTGSYLNWNDPEQAEIEEFVDIIYPVLEEVMGPPAFANEVVVLNDSDGIFPVPSFYYPRCNTISLATNWEGHDVIRALAYAFADTTYTYSSFLWDLALNDFIMEYVDKEILNMYPDMEARFTGHWRQIFPSFYSYDYDLRNQRDLSGESLNWVNRCPWSPLSSRPATAVFSKLFLAEPTFFTAFYASAYNWRDDHPLASPDMDIEIRNTMDSNFPDLSIEGRPVDEWLSEQYVIHPGDDFVGAGIRMFFEPTFSMSASNTIYFDLYAWESRIIGEPPFPAEACSPLDGVASLRFYTYNGEIIESDVLPIVNGLGNYNYYGINFDELAPQRIGIEIEFLGEIRHYNYPFFIDHSFGALGGLITDADFGEMRIQTDTGFDQTVVVEQGVFEVSGPLEPAIVTYTFTDPEGQTSRHIRNKWDDGYLPLLVHESQ